MERISDWFLDKLETASGLMDGIALLREVGERVGLPLPAATLDVDDWDPPLYRDRPLAVLMGWPEDWVTEFRAQGLNRYDPFTNYCRFEHRPFHWRTNDSGTTWKGQLLNGMPRHAMQALRKQVGVGITIPIYRTCGRIGHVTFTHHDITTDVESLFRVHRSDLFLIAHHFIDALDGWVKRDREIPDFDPLTPREKECLHWVSMGNTDEQVSRILFRSPATTRFHIKNAIRKLGATNRAHAISIAYQRRLLSPHF
ncbi:MAG: LuxR family transcriptional regulator [Alphaproteobacteria bacterium]|nr:MAG: LuxR family transcriptional regulator [Alphaproteobacteria bacterium]